MIKMVDWNATLYDHQHDFVAEYGKGLLAFVPHNPQQTILDLGCGTGTLTAQLAQLGTNVVGTDQSPAMIAQARQDHPEGHFRVQDALKMTETESWDVVFSNAVFHWIPDHEKLLQRISQALTTRGKLVCEFGAAGNIATIEAGFRQAFYAVGGHYHPKFNFQSVTAFTQLVEGAGLTVERCYDFDRPTPLKAGERGLMNWAQQFFASELATLLPRQQQQVLRELADVVRDRLWDGHQWVADYRRIRCIASK